MKKITIEDYLMGRADFMSLEASHQTNILKLLQSVNNLLQDFYDKEQLERETSSGYRTKQDHQRIYDDMNAKRKNAGLAEVKIPWGSKHLSGAAIDLKDADDKLKKFCTVEILKKHGLYMEHPDYTDSWCHLQIIKPGSGNQIFKPY